MGGFARFVKHVEGSGVCSLARRYCKAGEERACSTLCVKYLCKDSGPDLFYVLEG